MSQNMFCYQCQEAAGCTGCTNSGVCGKTPDVAAMQDLLVYVSRGISAGGRSGDVRHHKAWKRRCYLDCAGAWIAADPENETLRCSACGGAAHKYRFV